MSVHIIKYPGLVFTGRRAKHPADILQHSAAEADGGCQKKGRQIRAVKSFAKELSGCDQNFDVSLGQLFQDKRPFADIHIPGQDFSGDFMPKGQDRSQSFAVLFSVR